MPRRFSHFELLTPKEVEVLMHLCEGDTARQIARNQSVAISTVRTHIRSVLAKLGVHSQLEAVAMAWRHKWPQKQEQKRRVYS